MTLIVLYNVIRGHSVSDDIGIETAIDKTGMIEFASMSGGIHLHLDGELNSRFDVETHSGNIRNRITANKPTTSRYVRDETLRFKVGNGDGEVILSSHSGNIILDQK